MSRTVNITSTQAEIQDALARTDGKVFEAIGYLSTWAMPNDDYGFDTAFLSIGQDCDISCVYAHSGAGRRFYIAGIWNAEDKSYSFHS